MRVLRPLPFSFHTVEHCWIPVSDGVRLSARLWIPEMEEPVPAILEYIPYRKRDETRWRDEPMHGYFAGHGYAAVRVDVRGSGASEGILTDEYSEAEIVDGLEVLRWVADQPWCDGRVGMIGKSWGGINALQIAARRPPQLGAVITVCSSDDRFRTDAHYMGGLLLVENLTWGSVLLTLAARHPDPDVVGDGWRRTWLERLENLRLFPALWMRRQRRDAYWRRGSVAESYETVRCPVMAVGGWADAYTDTVPRLLAGLQVPRKGLIGPWAHVYPHHALPGPAVGFLQEALRWWDRWLRDEANGVDAEPAYRVWMGEAGRPPGAYADEHGRWVAEEAWPSPRIRVESCPLGEGAAIVPRNGASGLTAGVWCPFGLQGDLPGDQAEDDGVSLVFDFPPLGERLEILGAPAVELVVESDRPTAALAVRLCDVAPDGVSRRVSYGLLNLTRRNGLDRAEPLEPGRSYRVRVELGHAAWAFRPGHRVRVAVASDYWPVAWPLAEAGRVRVHTGRSRLELPVRPSRPEDEALRVLGPPEWAPSELDGAAGDETAFRRTIVQEAGTGQVRVEQTLGRGADGHLVVEPIPPIGLETGYGVYERFTVVPDDPLSARAEAHHVAVTCRGDWRTRLETRLVLTCDRKRFLLEASVTAWENGREIHGRSWSEAVPRDLL